jgi:hypothetical protein
MPSFDLFGFKFFFFSNEFVSSDTLEPVHIHVTDGSIMEKMLQNGTISLLVMK